MKQTKKQPHNKDFATWISRMGYSQKQFAYALGVKPQTLNGWIWGKYKPSPFHMAKICRQFGISYDELDSLFVQDDIEGDNDNA